MTTTLKTSLPSGHPLAGALGALVSAVVWEGGLFKELVSNQTASVTGGTATEVTLPAGPGTARGNYTVPVIGAGGNVKFANSNGIDSLLTTGTVLIAGYHTPNTPAFYPMIVSIGTFSAYGMALYLDDGGFAGNGTVMGRVLGAGSGNGAQFAAPGQPLGASSENQVHAVGMSWDADKTFIYHSGNTRYESLAVSQHADADTNRRTTVAGPNTGVIAALGFNRVLTEAEYTAWAADPTAFFDGSAFFVPVNDPPTFAGPNIGTINGVAGTAISSFSIANRFADTDTLTFTKTGTTWPSWLNLDSSTGVISGTPSVAAVTSGHTVTATDTASQSFVSNTFGTNIAAVNPPTTRRRVTALMSHAFLNRKKWAAAPMPSLVIAAAPAPQNSVNEFGMTVFADALTWDRQDMSSAVGANGPYSSAPYANMKHVRQIELRTSSRRGKVLWHGGDRQDSVGGDGSSHNWLSDPTVRPMTFTELDPLNPPYPGKKPGRNDEVPVMEDIRRRRVLVYPCPRFGGGGQEVPSAQLIFHHLMMWYPDDNHWEDLNPSAENTGAAVQLFDANGHQYPTSGKWGYYDFASDKYYIAMSLTAVVILNASDMTFAEWPYDSAEVWPWTYQSAQWGQGYGCVDRIRRRLVYFKGPQGDGQVWPDEFNLFFYYFDRPKGERWEVRQMANKPCDDTNSLGLDECGLVYYPALDSYVLMRAGVRIGRDASNTAGDNRIMMCPADGNSWVQLDPTDTPPEKAICKQIHWSESAGKLWATQGLGITAPEMWYPKINKRIAGNWPQWRKAIAPNTWGVIAATKTIAAVNPENDPAINPNYPASAPWHLVGGQHACMSAWSSAWYDHTRRTLYIPRQGGHGDYAGNESYKINLQDVDPGWIMYRKPSGAIGEPPVTYAPDTDNNNTGQYEDGRFRAVHGYNYVTGIPGKGPAIVRQTALANQGNDSRKTVLMDQDTGAEQVLKVWMENNPAYGTQLSVGAAMYDPERHCFWAMHVGGAALLTISALTGDLNFMSDSGSYHYAAGHNALIDIPNINAVLSFDGSTENGLLNAFALYKKDTIPVTRHPLTVTGSFAPGLGVQTGGAIEAGSIASGNGAGGAVWDRERAVLYIWHNTTNRAVISTLRPPASGDWFTGTWTRGFLTVDPANSVVPTAPQTNGTFGRFFYDPGLDMLGVINAVNQGLYVYALS